MRYDLNICVRCHKWPDLVLDTIDALQYHTDPRTTVVSCAVDNNLGLARFLESKLPGRVYNSPHPNGWGAGLMGLLCESILFAEANIEYEHFMCLDYDTLFIGKGADHDILGQINSPEIGLVGNYRKSQRWGIQYAADKQAIESILGPTPMTYTPGEGCSGAAFIITNAMIKAMKARGLLVPPKSDARSYTRMPEDHLIGLFCRICGLDIAPLPAGWRIQCDLTGNPMAMEKEGLKVFHPTKVRASCTSPSVEYKVRNHYRELRGQQPMKVRLQ